MKNALIVFIIVFVVVFFAGLFIFSINSDDDYTWYDYTEERGYICSYNAYNCENFSTQSEAQKVFHLCGSSDIHHLDGDDDGIACEVLPR